ncbi:MAG: DUF6461 domain-containing protein [Actinobacteria bacterium]|nr:DUF6461 domain-containing protein [Actinomycetota bacterium]
MSDGVGWATKADYAWADERDAYCVSFVEATAPEAVLDKMAGGCRTGILSVAEAREWVSEQTVPLYGSAVEAGIVGGWVVTFEATPYQATLPEILRIGRTSKGARAIVVLYAADGVLVRSFDPLRYDERTSRDGPPLPEESGLDFGNGHPMASAFACAERLTRVRLTSDLLDEHGDWLAIGHHPLHSLTSAASCAADMADAERGASLADDPHRQTIPNCRFWYEDIDDARKPFVPQVGRRVLRDWFTQAFVWYFIALTIYLTYISATTLRTDALNVVFWLVMLTALLCATGLRIEVDRFGLDLFNFFSMQHLAWSDILHATATFYGLRLHLTNGQTVMACGIARPNVPWKTKADRVAESINWEVRKRQD